MERILSESGKVVIWATFIHTIHGLKHYLENEGICCQELYGATPVEREGIDDDEYILTREKIVKAFQRPDCPFRVIISGMKIESTERNVLVTHVSFETAEFLCCLMQLSMIQSS